jgi:hypothetical protein
MGYRTGDPAPSVPQAIGQDTGDLAKERGLESWVFLEQVCQLLDVENC